jgi:hypothetical protein
MLRELVAVGETGSKRRAKRLVKHLVRVMPELADPLWEGLAVSEDKLVKWLCNKHPMSALLFFVPRAEAGLLNCHRLLVARSRRALSGRHGRRSDAANDLITASWLRFSKAS